MKASASEKRVGPRGSRGAGPDLAVGHHQRVGRASREMGLPGERDRLLHAGITGWNLSLRCRSEDALDAVEQSVLSLSLLGAARQS
jgi:hypothetical protein